MDYVFMTDASCDLSAAMVEEIGVQVLPMEFEIENNRYLHYPDCRMMSLNEFYSKTKKGATVKTTQINFNNFTTYFENYLRAGKDIIYTGIPTGLSGTYNTCLIAVKELEEKYPDRRIIVIDSLCDSAGLGLLVYLAGKKYNSGATIDELAKFIKDTRLKICHWFVVDDLDQLKRGGRISAVTATFGKALQIKISALSEHLKRDGQNLKKAPVFIAHADNPEGASELKKEIKGFCKNIHTCEIGPVIGAHVGSGMLALVFLGERNLS